VECVIVIGKYLLKEAKMINWNELSCMTLIDRIEFGELFVWFLQEKEIGRQIFRK
jgi:hypothetical protein